MNFKNLTKALTLLVALGLAPLAANAQFGGLLGGSKGGGGAVNPDQVEKHLRDYFSGINRMNRLLGEALKLNELSKSAEEKADCTQSGSCGLKDGASLAKGHSEEIIKKIKELQYSGVKMTEEESMKFTRSFEGFGKAVIAAKNAATDGKNMDKGMKALSIAANLPEVANSLKSTVNAVKAVIDYARFSGLKPDDMIKSVSSASADIGGAVPGLSLDFGK